MNKQWIKVKGIVKAGYQVASGKNKNSPYPQGSIAMQKDFFQALGLDISGYFLGTLNVTIAPYHFILKKPEYTFKKVQWNPHSIAEDFSFSGCCVTFQGIEYKGLIYYPHPETKPDHFQDDSTLEILAPPIVNINYGDALELAINSQEIELFFRQT
ncbi:conserved hypothetical protein [Rippkaea orientalis PCC 8801]|uniref:Uncharacterized protein n=1 Tax=Rippkaea orientalis (strain PCC 8801 / RF-1) TaxID=41431 RepID=B7K136_RIPO1|nr:hypothetical protein [Rippkaea orientalis]ACK65177.1 conserved hypothetical protein [Rippkaea orientalis PCC 8801]